MISSVNAEFSDLMKPQRGASSPAQILTTNVSTMETILKISPASGSSALGLRTHVRSDGAGAELALKFPGERTMISSVNAAFKDTTMAQRGASSPARILTMNISSMKPDLKISTASGSSALGLRTHVRSDALRRVLQKDLMFRPDAPIPFLAGPSLPRMERVGAKSPRGHAAQN